MITFSVQYSKKPLGIKKKRKRENKLKKKHKKQQNLKPPDTGKMAFGKKRKEKRNIMKKIKEYKFKPLNTHKNGN